ncbi:MAG TPA: NAD-glutamate dehydrogenase [Xanthobacteraceae bacterium]|nr:NAD-glutamate dehydrogenase [Xanthobacteraceae bacterium]
MNYASLPGNEEDNVAGLLIAAAGTLLEASKSDIPRDFVNGLFGLAVPEDLVRYNAREVIALAETAWAFMAERRPGAPKVRFEQPSIASEQLKTISVLEFVNDDMPFLVDSVLGELNELGVAIRLVVHPIFAVRRDSAGYLMAFHGTRQAAASAPRESFIQIHVDRIEDEARRSEIIQALEQVLADIRVCVDDWRPMTERVREAIAALKTNPPPGTPEEVAETTQFLEWLVANNFTFLGLRNYAFSAGDGTFEPRHESGLGLLRARELKVLRGGNQLASITPEIRAFLEEPGLLIVTKAAMRSRIHRRINMDYVGVKQFGPDGKPVGEFRIVGLFTSTVYSRSVCSIPYLRRKVDAVAARAGFNPDSHSGKALVNVLETFPRDELFQIDTATLFRFAMAILQLDERPRVRVLPRRDRFDRFVSILVFAPRERYDSSIRKRIGDCLAQAYNGLVKAFYPYITEASLVRVHLIIGRNAGDAPNPDRATLEAAVNAIIRTWSDGLCEALNAAHDPAKAQRLFERYRAAFSDGYRETYAPLIAVNDIRGVEGLSADRPLSADFHIRAHGEGIGLKVWSHDRPIPLSDRVPVLENMGFRVVDETTYRIAVGSPDEPDVWFHDMVLAGDVEADLMARKQALEACFIVVMTGGAESDNFNALVLTAGLMWRDVVLVRTIARFLRQIRIPFSQGYLGSTLVKHAGIATRIVQLFHTRFDPRENLASAESKVREELAAIEALMQKVESLDEDRILRHFVNAVTAATRTNFYQIDADGRPKAQIAIKFASRQVDGMPLPRPLYEIFVYSPRVEGVHLRFGKVARGGIRWSDRPQDFRTEVLGLVKAQQVKNAVIVPVGAKGGFVPKLLPNGPREAVQEEGIAAYKLFVSTLLDVSDNLGDNGVIPPLGVVRHDEDDPYLVVAADKGTAAFSDTANAISIGHNFWLGDAFASGGSVGYDHKKIAITARGAWESVKRHFRELDIDIGKSPFSVVGVGDMSGDVFGNGLLREQTIRLVAAFDHRDIFIDPDPDLAHSFAERQRLFDLPRSSWQDYDKSLISPGGGVYSRSAKEIVLSGQAQAILGLAKAKATPQEVMNAILKAPADLIFFGGIGTYVRASAETDEAVGDRANDAIRVTGAELRCKVVGEGANLGMTQRGRVEAALRGIRLNTDAIDNSAGVNTSDIEVNIKIALATPMRDGRLTIEARNALLAVMTDEVAALVLRNNYQQPLSLSLAERRGLEDLGFEQRLMQTLEAAGELDRAVEYLPDELEIADRRKRSLALTRPELAVLIAYAKLSLKHDLLQSDVPDDPYLARELGRYFPAALAERFPDALEKHRLRRDIIVTQLANSMINRGGPSLVVRIADQTGASAARIAQAFAAVRDSYGMTALNTEIDGLDNVIAGKLQLDLYAAVQDLLLDRLVWFLRNADFGQGLVAIVEHYRSGIVAVEAALDHVLSEDSAKARNTRTNELMQGGVPEALARRIASLSVLVAAPDIVLVADRTGQNIANVAATYFAAESYFRLDRIAQAARGIKVSDYFDRLALDRALDSIGEAERRLAAAMAADGATGALAVETWVAARKTEVERIRTSVHAISNSGLTLSKLSVAASLLGDLVKA